MDSNSTITLGLLFMLLGGIGTVVGIVSNRDAKKINEGREHGVMITKLDNIENGQVAILSEVNQVKQQIRDVEQQINEIDNRVTVLETKRKRSVPNS